jgi:hypothetical protein
MRIAIVGLESSIDDLCYLHVKQQKNGANEKLVQLYHELHSPAGPSIDDRRRMTKSKSSQRDVMEPNKLLEYDRILSDMKRKQEKIRREMDGVPQLSSVLIRDNFGLGDDE